MPTTLSSLPNEILHQIALLSGNDVKNLRAANKSVNAAVDRATWEVLPIVLNLSLKNLDRNITMLEELSHASASADRFLVLDIKSLDPSRRRDNISFRDLWVVGEIEEDTEKVTEARRKLPEIVSKALSALKGLEVVRWLTTQNDPENVHVAVIESLGSLPHLVDLQINIETCGNIPPLHYLKNESLRNLAIQQRRDKISEPVGQASEGLLHLLRSESVQGLESLDVSDACEDRDERSNQLAHQFSDEVLHRLRSTLKKLTLIPSYTGDWTVGLDSLSRFDECTQLTYLCVAFSPDEVRPGAGDNDVVASFIARIARLSNLPTLVVVPVCSRSYNLARQDVDRPPMVKMRILEEIKDSVRKTVLPDTFRTPYRPLRIVLLLGLTSYWQQRTEEFRSYMSLDGDGGQGGMLMRFQYFNSGMCSRLLGENCDITF
ncbi:hypothetical protein PQX77_008345 [Marasmius sp. AFHP31]|nr:hypothetical protein PQX77_008345 [Marasmius sp. AFHP31]